MPIAYYAQAASEAHWSGLWQKQQLDYLLAVARRDSLSQHLEANLPKSGLILEGGCGLGQYVLFFRRRGHNLIGGDFSLPTLQTHRQAEPASPLLGMDLLRLPFADDVLAGHISIGVIEHLEHGPQAMLCEFYRTLRPGGVLLVSVPWVNSARRLLAPLIRRRQSRRQGAGVSFYQYAYSRHELSQFLTETGFTVCAFYPYSPAKGLREILHLVKLRGNSPSQPVANTPTSPTEIKDHPLRGLLYAVPVLNTFAHMLLAVAIKP